MIQKLLIINLSNSSMFLSVEGGESKCIHTSASHVSLVKDINAASANICFLAMEMASSSSSPIAILLSNNVAPHIERKRGQIHDVQDLSGANVKCTSSCGVRVHLAAPGFPRMAADLFSSTKIILRSRRRIERTSSTSANLTGCS